MSEGSLSKQSELADLGAPATLTEADRPSPLDPSKATTTPPETTTMTEPLKEKTQLIKNGNVKAETSNKKPYPKAVFFIVGNEFCERFSYYGMRAILVLYLTNWLQFDKDTATAIYHGFVVLCYFMPIFGAILADGYLNKYRTILYLSIIYGFGNIIMTFTAFPPPFWVGPVIGLILIGFGTGGIKPCVSAFGGDQFSSEQEKERGRFFSVFYFSINLGSFISMVITPLVREYTQCFGSSCYPVAFGIPAILMLLALSLFYFGHKWYKIYPPTGSVVKNFFCCIGRSIKIRCKRGSEKKEHWLDYADDKYDASFLNEVKCVLRTFVLCLPLPVFWALFDQQGSRWTLQSIQLDRHLTNNWYLPPDQIQAINPILILVLIPIFEWIVYPLLDKCKIPNRPLQRMVVGMFLAAIAFVLAGFLQLKIDNSLSYLKPSAGQSSLYVVNLSPCQVNVTNVTNAWTATPLGQTKQTDKFLLNSMNYTIDVSVVGGENKSCSLNRQMQDIQLMSEKAYHIITVNHLNKLESELFEYPLDRSSPEGSSVGVIYAGELSSEYTRVTLKEKILEPYYEYDVADFDVSTYKAVVPGSYSVSVGVNATKPMHVDDFECKDGAVYTLVIYSDGSELKLFQLIELRPTSVSMWYQLPQYIVITIAEVLFAITGLSFTYSQAPESMKSVVQAGWLLTTAFGNLIDVIIAGVRIPSQAVEFFFFAILMGITTAIFAVISYFYKYIDTSSYIDLDAQSDEQRLTDAAEPIASDPVKDKEDLH